MAGMIRWLALGVWVLALGIFTGCGKPGTVAVHEREIGKSVHGRPIVVQEIGEGPEHVLIGATIHGNEWAGTPIVERLKGYLIERPDLVEGRTVCIIPVMNPDGFHFNTRGNANGVDLNRNFPADNRENSKRYGMEAFSEPESKAWYDYITSCGPVRMVIFHQPYDQVDWDGPAEVLAQHMARHTIMPALRVGARPGSMGSHYGVDKNLPIITYELPRHAEKESAEYLWDTYGRATVAAITWPVPVSLGYFSSAWRWDLLAPWVILGVAVMGARMVGLVRRRGRP